MGKLADDSTIDQKTVDLSNIFYDTFSEVVDNYDKTNMEVWKETCTISLADTKADVGLFDKSDIIVAYNIETHLPTIVTERIYRCNYSWRDWYRMRKYLKEKLKVIKQELGFNIRVSYSKDYIDYVHYKEEWWQWALQHTKES